VAFIFFGGQDSEPTHDIPDRIVAEETKAPASSIEPVDLMVVLFGVFVFVVVLFVADLYLEAPRRAREKADREKDRDENSREQIEGG
jgi:hypothetical protein